MSAVHYIIGDSMTVMATLPAGSVDLILTSPPFLALRNYLPDGHPDKQLEMGSEATPAAFLDGLLAWTAECGRVLADHGSLCVELGDTYSSSGASGTVRNGKLSASGDVSGTNLNIGGHHMGGPGWPLPKSLALIPEAYRLSLAYGRNILTGQPSPAGLWRIRNVIRICRPNPPVGALGDKMRPATSEMVVACRSKNRWFDLDAVRGPDIVPSVTKVDMASASRGISGGDTCNPDKERSTGNPAGAPPLDWWKIVTEPSPGAHYATWSRELCVIPVKSMCPLERCATCGTPRRRIIDVQGLSGVDFLGTDNDRDIGLGGARSSMPNITRETVGWTDCSCVTPDYRPGVVLDPFGGTGTTGLVSAGHGRNCLLIDIDERNAELALERIGPLFLTVGPDVPVWLTEHR